MFMPQYSSRLPILPIVILFQILIKFFFTRKIETNTHSLSASIHPTHLFPISYVRIRLTLVLSFNIRMKIENFFPQQYEETRSWILFENFSKSFHTLLPINVSQWLAFTIKPRIRVRDPEKLLFRFANVCAMQKASEHIASRRFHLNRVVYVSFRFATSAKSILEMMKR